MVRKITSGEYLKRYDNMTAEERSDYLVRVGDWLSVDGQCLVKKGEAFETRLQNVLQVSVGWNDAECAAFEEGAVLLSALVGVADTKLPELLYAISAKRSVKRMFSLLWETEAGVSENGHVKHGEKAGADATGMTNDKDDTAVIRADMKKLSREAPLPLFETQVLGKPAVTARKPKETAGNDAAVAGRETAGRSDGGRMQAGAAKEALIQSPTPTPVRPRHFDQYAHLLPQKTQERIAKYGTLMRELEDARHKMSLLMDDQSASAADREAWAKRATAIDKELGAIRREADKEWDKLAQSGRVVVDDLGNARVVPVADKPADEATETVAVELTSEQKHRRRDLRKWLIDTRRGNGAAREERIRKWYENFREYLALEGDAAFGDAKIKAAIAHYGIDEEKLKEGLRHTEVKDDRA